MVEKVVIPQSNSKEEIYTALIPQLKALVFAEKDCIANLANITSVLKYALNYFWVGFYLVKENELVLGPFQGTLACTRISYGKGVCGKCWQTKEIIIVPDVENFPEHIACSSLSKSEIVLPVFDKNNNVVMVLDIDSDKLNEFNETDRIYLQKVVEIVEDII